MGNNSSTFANDYYFWKLVPTKSTIIPEDCISNSQNPHETTKNAQNSKDHDSFSVLRKKRVEYLKSIFLDI